jgi:antitoxin StbD
MLIPVLTGHIMTRLLTSRIASMTDLREPQKVLAEAQGQPVAILRNSRLVGYFVPAEAVSADATTEATEDAILASLERREAVTRPVVDYLRDK